MPRQAVLCRGCGKHQSALREYAVYIASLAGLLTIFISGLTFIGSNWDYVYGRFFRRAPLEVKYLAIMPGRIQNIVTANNGRSTIFVESISFASAGWRFPHMMLSQSIPSADLAHIVEDSGSWAFKRVLVTPEGKVPDDLYGKVDMDARSDKKCFVPYFYAGDTDDVSKMDAVAADGKVARAKATIVVRYFSGLHSNASEASAEGVVTFYQRDRSECEPAAS